MFKFVRGVCQLLRYVAAQSDRTLPMLRRHLHVCSLQYAVSLLFTFICYLLISLVMYFNILLFVFFFCIFVFYFVYSVFLYCFVYCFSLCIQLPNIFFVHVYRPLPPRGNTTAVNKYHIAFYHITFPLSRKVSSTLVMRVEACLDGSGNNFPRKIEKF